MRSEETKPGNRCGFHIYLLDNSFDQSLVGYKVIIIIRVSIESIETRWSVRKLRRWKLFPSNCHSYHHHHHHHFHHYCRIPSNISHHTHRGDKKDQTSRWCSRLIIFKDKVTMIDIKMIDIMINMKQTSKTKWRWSISNKHPRQNDANQYQQNIKDKMINIKPIHLEPMWSEDPSEQGPHIPPLLRKDVHP